MATRGPRNRLLGSQAEIEVLPAMPEPIRMRPPVGVVVVDASGTNTTSVAMFLPDTTTLPVAEAVALAVPMMVCWLDDMLPVAETKANALAPKVLPSRFPLRLPLRFAVVVIPVSCDPLPRKNPAETLAVVVMLPVLEIVFEPNAANNVVTLALPYVAGNPVSCEPLPRMNPPLTLAVVVMLPVELITFDPSAANSVVTLALPYVAGRPVSCDPLPKK